MAVKRVRVPGGWKKAADKKSKPAMPIGFKGAKKPKKVAPVWQPPPLAEKALNPELTNPESRKSKLELSNSMHAILGSSPSTIAYRVNVEHMGPTAVVTADGHSIEENRLILRKGFLVVAIFNRWVSFRIDEKPEA